jgi:hypothetical protein
MALDVALVVIAEPAVAVLVDVAVPAEPHGDIAGAVVADLRDTVFVFLALGTEPHGQTTLTDDADHLITTGVVVFTALQAVSASGNITTNEPLRADGLVVRAVVRAHPLGKLEQAEAIAEGLLLFVAPLSDGLTVHLLVAPDQTNHYDTYAREHAHCRMHVVPPKGSRRGCP